MLVEWFCPGENKVRYVTHDRDDTPAPLVNVGVGDIREIGLPDERGRHALVRVNVLPPTEPKYAPTVSIMPLKCSCGAQLRRGTGGGLV